ncbi:MAG: hypothetical protein FWD35_04690 [Oscillospiraceae bacterium]|nr:hypothetical protein [Oscillospiraceae bacterium]
MGLLLDDIMLKRLIVLLSLFSLAALAGCDLLGVGNGGLGEAGNLQIVFDEVVENVEGLDEIVAYMSDNFFMSAKMRLSSIELWDELELYYGDNVQLSMKRGIGGLGIEYREIGGLVEATIFPVYEMFQYIIISHERAAPEMLNADETKVYEAAKDIVRAVDVRETTLWDRVYALHEYLKANIVYEHGYADNPSAFDVYGALIDGRAVCQGYAQAFRLLLHLAGIESVIVTGRAGGELHAWNLVNYSSSSASARWYHVDVTWNDRDDADSNRFFNVSDEVLGDTHTWKRGYFPHADSMYMNYFQYRGIVADTGNGLEQLFGAAFSRGLNFIEIVCAFRVGQDNLRFLPFGASYAITPYGNAELLTIKFEEG